MRFTDPFATVGASAELDTAPVNLFGQALYVNHDNPFGDGEHADYWAFRLEARAPLGPRFFTLAALRSARIPPPARTRPSSR